MKASNSLLHKHLLKPDPKSNKIFRFTEVMATLLSLVAEVPEELIKNTRIYPRTPLRYIPFYPAHKGGGAITLGNNNWQSITYTENFFSDNKEVFGNKAYANKLDTWIRLSAHEVGHLNHATRFGSIIIYLIVFIYQYMRYGHAAAPLEKEANLGTRNLRRFNMYLHENEDGLNISACISSDLSEQEKITQIKAWWAAYLDSIS